MKITVLGAGAWGTALAKMLQEGGHTVTLWGHDAARVAEARRTGRNERYLPGIALPAELEWECDIDAAIARADVVVMAIPSKAFREVSARLNRFSGLVVSVTKGIEHETGLTMCGILSETIPDAPVAALSGPSFAIEVARGIPTAIVAASQHASAATSTQMLFTNRAFRVYTSQNLLGVELGGALKNVIAIAAGVCDGLKFGDNSKAALVTRAIAEVRRLGVACGAQAETFTGLSGLGDLTVTCFSRWSRNRSFGEQIGRGAKPEEIIAAMTAIAEGYPTARSAFALAKKLDVTTPVIDEVYWMLYEGKNVQQGLHDLMSRDLKAED